MQARDVMTRGVVTVGPGTSARYAAEVMAGRGFAALPVVGDDDRVIGIVAEADVLRRRIPEDPRLHLRRDTGPGAGAAEPPLLVGEVMTTGVRTVDAGTDVADVARLFVDERLRSVPVLEHGRLVGIVSRRDLLGVLVRPDGELRRALLDLLEEYTGERDAFAVSVSEGVAHVERVAGAPHPSAEAEERVVHELARTVGGIVAVHVTVPLGASGTPAATAAPTTGGDR